LAFRDISAAAAELKTPISIRVSRRARRIALRINAAERSVELVLPPGVPASHMALRPKQARVDRGPPRSIATFCAVC